MLLSISTTYRPATDLGFLLHKHPERFQTFDPSFGKAHLFYPEVAESRATTALLLDVDPVGMVRGKSRNQSFLLGHYVNDRPYVASSFLSVAISQVLGSAMAGRCKDRPNLVATPIPLSARLEVLPVRGGESFLHRVFEPLGYTVNAIHHPLVVKPLEFVVRGKKGLVQPALKCRGPEYLRIIYGPDYTAAENLPRLRSRSVSGKRSLALREFALGIEALERFVRREPLRRVHECVFGVLALESEPVDPRL